MDSRLTLRPALPEDEAFLYQVYASTRTEELAPLPWSEEEKAAFLFMQFTAQQRHYHQHYPDADFQVILLEEIPIGRLYVARLKDEIRLMDIALLPRYRTAGLGTSLIQDILSEADQEGKPVRIHVETFNPALRLYQRLGFSVAEELGVYLFMERLPR